MENIGSSIYQGSASIGKIQGYVGLFIGGFIAIILVVVALYLFSVDESNLVDVTGTVSSASCRPLHETPEKIMINVCDLQVSYNINGTTHTGTITTNSISTYSVGNSIQLTYDSKNPSNVTERQFRSKTIAFILLFVSILVGGGSYLNYYMVTNSEAYAAFSGASSVYRTF